MGLFDFWKNRGGVQRAGLFDVPDRLDKLRYLASLAGDRGLMALRVSGFAKHSAESEAVVFARYIGRRGPDGKVEFVEATAQQASDWVLMKTALLKSAGSFEAIKMQNGGTVVLSSDVNVTRDAGIIGRVKAMVDTFIQRYFTRGGIVEKTIEQVEQRVRPPEMHEDDRVIPAYSMGNLFIGRYYSRDPETKKMVLYNEKSFAVEIRGVDSDTLNEVANAMREAFSQESVLVINDNEHETYLIQNDGQKEAPQTAA